MANTGKTGADAIFKALKRICIVISHYGPKLQTVITTMETSALLTTAQATAARSFITAAQSSCDVFAVIADYSGF